MERKIRYSFVRWGVRDKGEGMVGEIGQMGGGQYFESLVHKTNT